MYIYLVLYCNAIDIKDEDNSVSFPRLSVSPCKHTNTSATNMKLQLNQAVSEQKVTGPAEHLTIHDLFFITKHHL